MVSPDDDAAYMASANSCGPRPVVFDNSSIAVRTLPTSAVVTPARVVIRVNDVLNLFDIPTAATPAAAIGAVRPNVIARPAAWNWPPSFVRFTPDFVTLSVAAAAACIPAMY